MTPEDVQEYFEMEYKIVKFHPDIAEKKFSKRFKVLREKFTPEEISLISMTFIFSEFIEKSTLSSYLGDFIKNKMKEYFISKFDNK